jgi:hypothetical protein
MQMHTKISLFVFCKRDVQLVRNMRISRQRRMAGKEPGMPVGRTRHSTQRQARRATSKTSERIRSQALKRRQSLRLLPDDDLSARQFNLTLGSRRRWQFTSNGARGTIAGIHGALQLCEPPDVQRSRGVTP